MTYTVQPWIDGAHIPGNAGTSDIYNPATGEVVGKLEYIDGSQLQAAVRSAAKAQREWAETSLPRRQNVFFALRQLLLDHLDEVAQHAVREHGKTLSDARGEIKRGLETVEYACGIGANSKGEHSLHVGSGVDLTTFRQPLGVVAGIVPFNFPAMVPMWMFPLALATGNAFILKPSDPVPSAAMALGPFLKEAGLPDGLFQILPMSNELTAAMIDHPLVKAVSFVGSTKVARIIRDRATASGTRVQALGGANNHAIVMPDADQDFVAKQLAAAAFGAAGERCMALPVAVAVGEAFEGLAQKVAQYASEIAKVGHGNDPQAGFGPVISAAAKERITTWIDEAEQRGAKVVLDGRHASVAGYEGGFWLGPTIVEDVPRDCPLYCEEVFGPVLVIERVQSYREAIALVNANKVGNGSAIFTNDGGIARRFELDVEAGMVGVNVPIPTPVAYYSFGGWKDSLLGDHHIHGPEGVRFYTRAKAVTRRWPTDSGLYEATLSFEKED